jgi:hypothetical protein
MSSRTEMIGAKRITLRLLLIVVTLTAMFGPGIREHIRFGFNPWNFNDDVRQQMWPLLRYADAKLFRDDYVADYFLANYPRGFRLLYELSAPFVDPRAFGKALPYAQLLVVLCAAMAAAWRLAGPAAAWGSGALCLSGSVFLGRMTGGLPRSFAFPLVALAVLALVRGRSVQLCVLTVAGAAFYYSASILLGVCAAFQILVMPKAWQGDSRSWSLRRRITVLSITAALAALLVAPATIAVRPFGRLLGPADVAAYPEAGPGGRYVSDDVARDGELANLLKIYGGQTLLSSGPPWNRALNELGRSAAKTGSLPIWVGVLLAAGSLSLCVSQLAARRLLALVAASCVLYPTALALAPRLYLPARYLIYPLPVLVVVLLPASVASLAQRLRPLRSTPFAVGAAVVGVVALVLLFLGGRGPGHAGITVSIPEEARPLYEFIARLPPDARIAGFPSGTVDNVPYLCARKTLLGYEVHQAFHQHYAEQMRRRMEAFIDAYFASGVAPLQRLRSEFGVTHLIVNRDHYQGTPLTYFLPFDDQIAAAFRIANGQPETLRQAATASVFELGRAFILDLDRITTPPPPVDSGH